MSLQSLLVDTVVSFMDLYWSAQFWLAPYLKWAGSLLLKQAGISLLSPCWCWMLYRHLIGLVHSSSEILDSGDPPASAFWVTSSAKLLSKYLSSYPQTKATHILNQKNFFLPWPSVNLETHVKSWLLEYVKPLCSSLNRTFINPTIRLREYCRREGRCRSLKTGRKLEMLSSGHGTAICKQALTASVASTGPAQGWACQ